MNWLSRRHGSRLVALALLVGSRHTSLTGTLHRGIAIHLPVWADPHLRLERIDQLLFCFIFPLHLLESWMMRIIHQIILHVPLGELGLIRFAVLS